MMTVQSEGLEYNILGCNVRIKQDEADQNNAKQAIDTVNNEINALKLKNPKLKDLDLAVLVALKIASDKNEIESEYKENVFALRSGINDALHFIEEVSPGSMQTNQVK